MNVGIWRNRSLFVLFVILFFLVDTDFGILPAYGGIPQELNRIIVMNETGRPITQLFSSPGDSSVWGPDLIAGLGTLAYGSMRSFFIHYTSACARFSFTAIDDFGSVYQVHDLQVCNGEEALLTISLEHAVDASEIQYLKRIRVILSNSVHRDFWYLFFSPRDSKMWGVDILDDISTLPVGSSRVYWLMVPPEGADYDILGFDEVDRSYAKKIRISPSDDPLYIELSEADYH